MLGTLYRERYRPPFASTQWLKYWAKRARMWQSLVSHEMRSRRFARECAAFGDRTVLSPLKISGPLGRMSIGSDCAIGRTDIQLHASITIGNCVVINDGCQLLTGTHDVHSPSWDLIARPIVIEDYAWIATGAIILPGVTIGRAAVVGAGAVVAKSVSPGSIVAGNPACAVGRRASTCWEYRPSAFSALFEAWLGPPRLLDCSDIPSGRE